MPRAKTVSGERSAGPIRHALKWDEPAFYDGAALNQEMARVFDICHSCRRCVNLCNTFPTLFDLVDRSGTGEVDGVATQDYFKVVDQCYMCDLCYAAKCPYVPPHEWAVDFPYLMLRAKTVRYKDRKSHKNGLARMRDAVFSSPDAIGRLAVHPGVNQAVNRALGNRAVRKMLQPILGLAANARVPQYNSRRASKTVARDGSQPDEPVADNGTSGAVALFAGCYGDYNDLQAVKDIVAVFKHNGIVCEPLEGMKCCGMPRYDLGDLDAVYKLNKHNGKKMREYVDAGYDIVGLVPSCTLMMRREVVSLFPGRVEISAACKNVFDPAEYLMLRHKSGRLNTDFETPLGKVVYHAACHQRVQNIGPKTRDLLSLIPDTDVAVIERCSGHDGTYAMRVEHNSTAVKLAQPAARKLAAAKPDFFTSDCMLAGHHIAHVAGGGIEAHHPISLLRKAYAIRQD